MCFCKKVIIKIWIDIWESEKLENMTSCFLLIPVVLKYVYSCVLIGHFFLTEAIFSKRDPGQFYQKWSNFDNVFFFFFFFFFSFWLMRGGEGGSKYHHKRAIIVPPAKRHLLASG